jgi:F-type H+-transporting ATPase subunit b
MGKLFEALGLDLRILFAQLINFAILLVALYYVAYKPVFKFLKERREGIEKGVRNADEAEVKLKNATKKEEDIINNAKKEALKIVEKAREEGNEKRGSIIEKAKEEVEVIIQEEKAKIRMEKAETLKEIKKEVSEIVILALEKVLDEKIDSKSDQELIEKVTKSLE